MFIEFDPAKNQKNIEERGLPFSLVKDFDFENMLDDIDARHLPEIRIIAISRIRFHVYVLVYTMRDDVLRVISLRRANKKERIAWLTNLIHF
jgi:uncharacterized protein